MNLDRALEVCIELALKAGEKVIEIYETDFSVDKKQDNSPLTMADLESNKIIVFGLKEAFPEVSILSEESKDNLDRLNHVYCFIVDPIDGTKEFVNRNGEFTVNIGLSYKGKAVCGVIYAPVKNTLYYGAEHIGAFKSNTNEHHIIDKQEIKVRRKINDLLIVGSKSHQSEQFRELVQSHKDKINDVVSIGSSLKGCLVAEGVADIYYRFGFTNEWDTCAMQAIVESAGAIMRQMDNSLLTYNREKSLNDKGFYIVNMKQNIFV